MADHDRDGPTVDYVRSSLVPTLCMHSVTVHTERALAVHATRRPAGVWYASQPASSIPGPLGSYCSGAGPLHFQVARAASDQGYENEDRKSGPRSAVLRHELEVLNLATLSSTRLGLRLGNPRLPVDRSRIGPSIIIIIESGSPNLLNANYRRQPHWQQRGPGLSF